MRAGDLRHSVTIQQATSSRNSYNEKVLSWSDFATVYAAVEPLQGREYWDAQAINAERTVRFRIRYRSDVTPLMRVSWDSRLFDINAVLDVDGRQRELHLMTTEVVE